MAIAPGWYAGNLHMMEVEHDLNINERMGENRRTVDVLCFGHSFIRRLELFTLSNPGLNANLGLDYDQVRVSYYHVPGARAFQLMNHHLAIIQHLMPEIVYLQVGTCDLSVAHLGPEVVGSRIHDLACRIRDMGVRLVIIGQILFRATAGIPEVVPLFNEKVVIANQYLETVFDQEFCIRFWKHRGF